MVARVPLPILWAGQGRAPHTTDFRQHPEPKKPEGSVSTLNVCLLNVLEAES